MLFFEPLFLFQAFPIFYAVYCLARRKAVTIRWLLLVASIAFYFWGEPRFVPVVLVSALFDYVLARGIGSALDKRSRTWLLGVGIAQNLAILIVYKYADFLLASVYALAGRGRAPALGLALPIGVSFIVFEKISCLVDVHRGTTSRPRSLPEYCLFVFFFPKLLAGPIIKYHEIRDQIVTPRAPTTQDAVDGIERFARGAIKKLLLADTMGVLANGVFDPQFQPSPASAWLGLLGFTLQVYFDFSGYSDMAIGLARMLGFELRENFNLPYTSRSFGEFWRRWHISLSTWIRDYLYIPLGGNRRTTGRTYFNLWVCFLAVGAWHGAAWNFVVWGAYNGLVLSLERLFLRDVLERLPPRIANALTVAAIMLGFVIFRSSSLAQAGHLYATLFNPHAFGHRIELDNFTLAALVAGVVICAMPRLPGYGALERQHESGGSLRTASSLCLAALFVFAWGHVFAGSLKPFIYFRF